LLLQVAVLVVAEQAQAFTLKAVAVLVATARMSQVNHQAAEQVRNLSLRLSFQLTTQLQSVRVELVTLVVWFLLVAITQYFQLLHLLAVVTAVAMLPAVRPTMAVLVVELNRVPREVQALHHRVLMVVIRQARVGFVAQEVVGLVPLEVPSPVPHHSLEEEMEFLVL
jgi:hypothetical protein